MPLLRASCQGGHLLDSYEALGRRPEAEWQCYAKLMLALIPSIERLCVDIPVWALLSHERLCLLAADDYRSPWHVIISAEPFDESYDLRYLMALDEAPWPNAIVCGGAASASQAADMVHVAMLRSRAWPGLARPDEPR